MNRGVINNIIIYNYYNIIYIILIIIVIYTSMFIFPRVKYIQMTVMRGAPPGSIGAANPPSCSNERTFREFLDHFIAHAHPSKDNQVVLLMDNHASHISIDAIAKAKENGIHCDISPAYYT